MPAFDIDGIEAVESLDDIRWEVREPFGPYNIQRHVYAETIHRKSAWAVVLVAVQDYKRDLWEPTRYVLTRYRKIAGAWRLQNHFRIPESPLLLLAAASSRFIETVRERESKLQCGSSSLRALSQRSRTASKPTP